MTKESLLKQEGKKYGLGTLNELHLSITGRTITLEELMEFIEGYRQAKKMSIPTNVSMSKLIEKSTVSIVEISKILSLVRNKEELVDKLIIRYSRMQIDTDQIREILIGKNKPHEVCINSIW